MKGRGGGGLQQPGEVKWSLDRPHLNGQGLLARRAVPERRVGESQPGAARSPSRARRRGPSRRARSAVNTAQLSAGRDTAQARRAPPPREKRGGGGGEVEREHTTAARRRALSGLYHE